MNKKDFIGLIEKTFSTEVLKKIVFSRPEAGEIKKIVCRLCAHRGRRLLAMEYSLPDNTVSHKNLTEEQLDSELSVLILNYRQVNLLTALGDAEYKRRGDKEVVLGGDSLKRKLEGEIPAFAAAVEALDKKKNYILSGNEKFLIKLGISSQDGRIHDKKQGKFRQINKFLEHIEELYPKLPEKDEILIYDLCCGKSYLSFAVYHYLTEVKKRRVLLYGLDLKRDVILWCDRLAKELGFVGMKFEVGDISELISEQNPDMVISLHACDIATDIVINTAISLNAKIVLSTPCCHRYLNGKIITEELGFITQYPHISNKLCEAVTDALRLARLRANGYSVSALELTDPENTPKNTLIRAIKNSKVNEEELKSAKADYEATLRFLLGDKAKDYLSEIK